jgi:nitrogen fixation protein FixH
MMGNGTKTGMSKTFTGRHMAVIMFAFFGVVIAVNFFMAYRALEGFGGTVVENSYVASQKYNGWLRAAREQKALGWSVRTDRNAEGRLIVTAQGQDDKLLVGRATGVLRHPLGVAKDVPVELSGAGPWTSLAPIPKGRWRLRLTLEAQGKREPFVIDLP